MAKKKVVVVGLRILAILVVAYVAVGALLFFAQGWLIFPAPSISKADLREYALHAGATELELVAEDGTKLYGWHLPSRGEGVVLYFGGNAEAVPSSSKLQRLVRDAGYDFVTVAVRGYPGSEGSPGQAGMHLDALAAWKLVTEQMGFAPERVVLHGRSLGGGIVGTVFGEVEPGGVVLESTFTGISDIVGGRYWMYPTSILLKHPFDTRSRAPAVTCPVLLVHGADDATIPAKHSRLLKKAFKDVRHLELPGWAHNDGVLTGADEARGAYRELLNMVRRAPARAK